MTDFLDYKKIGVVSKMDRQNALQCKQRQCPQLSVNQRQF